MSARFAIRNGRPEDARACAGILNGWIDRTPWMPRVHSRQDVIAHYERFVFKKRHVLVTGRPPVAYIALDDEDYVTSLFSSKPGKGAGKALLDHAKLLRDQLHLWTFAANTLARSFYLREGFEEVDRSDGDNEERLPDVKYFWRST